MDDENFTDTQVVIGPPIRTYSKVVLIFRNSHTAKKYYVLKNFIQLFRNTATTIMAKTLTVCRCGTCYNSRWTSDNVMKLVNRGNKYKYEGDAGSMFDRPVPKVSLLVTASAIYYHHFQIGANEILYR